MMPDKSEKKDHLDTPETDAEWFSLISPAIDVNPEAADKTDVIVAAEHHAEQAVRRTGMDVDLDPVDWEASWRLKSYHGTARGNSVKLALHSLETNGWQRLMQTVRHELIHVWQYQNDEFDSTGSTQWERGHGLSFERWMPVLNISKRGGSVLSTWTIECPTCQNTLERITKRRKHQISEFVHSPESLTCVFCEEEVSEFTVKRQNEEVDVEEPPRPPRPVPSDKQKLVSLYDKPQEAHDLDDLGNDPQIQSLTELTGVGDATAVALGDDIHIVEDLVAQDGGLRDDLLSKVSTEYQDALRDDVLEWYTQALVHRGEDDPRRFDDVVKKLKREGDQASGRDDGSTDTKAMCRTLRNDVEPGDSLELTFEDSEECTLLVTDKIIWSPVALGVSGSYIPADAISEVGLHVPAPHRLEDPYLKIRRRPEGVKEPWYREDTIKLEEMGQIH